MVSSESTGGRAVIAGRSAVPAPRGGRAANQSRRLPAVSTVLAEEFRVFAEESLVAKPLVIAGPGVLLLVFVLEQAAWVALPVWLGFSFGMSSFSHRLLGRGVGWEMPVERTASNVVRNLAGLGWMLLASLILTPMLFLLAGEPLNADIVPAVVMASSWAIIPFVVAAIFSQLVNPVRRYLLPLSLVLLLPLMFFPSRGMLAILPAFLDPIVDGRYGLNSFSGRTLMLGGITAPQWDPGVWIISAAIWLTTAFSMLFVVASTHQE